MNVDVVNYNASNGYAVRAGQELIEHILEDGLTNVKFIVDIGCGSGNLTKILAERILHKKILCLDIDADMVKHAEKLNEGNDSLEFFVQDISAPWQELDKRLTDLEGTVDIAYSNQVLHWIPDARRARAAENILKLLKHGGRCYINTTLTKDFNFSLPTKEKEENEKLIKVPSLETQHEWWREYFTQAGLSPLTVQYKQISWEFGNKVMKELVDYAPFWKRYISKDVPVEEHDEIIKKFGDLIILCFGHPVNQPYEKSIDEVTTYYFGQFRILGVKP